MGDFVSENQAFLLTAAGLVISALGACGMCILKSRCTRIACCGVEINRDVIPAKDLHLDNTPAATTPRELNQL